MKKGSEIPDGYIACAIKGKLVNLSKSDVFEIEKIVRNKRYVWNYFLDMNIKSYQKHGKFIFYPYTSELLSELRMLFPIFATGSSVIQQTTLIALDKALKSSFPGAANRKGFPRWKRAGSKDSITVPSAKVKRIQKGNMLTHIAFPKLPLMRVRGIEIPEGARITNMTIRRSGNGWTLSVGLVKPKPLYVDPELSSVGIDMGLRTMATVASYKENFLLEVQSPRALKRDMKRLRRAQRICSKRKKGSVNRRRKAKYITRLHNKISNKRQAHCHRATRKIVNLAGQISIESLNVKGMMKTHYAKSLADVGIGEFLRQIRYKADWAGRKINALDRFQRSTGCCPECDHVGPRLTKGQTSWNCEKCSVEHDRDIAAARWIDKVGVLCPEPVRDENLQSPKRSSDGRRKSLVSSESLDANPGSLANTSHAYAQHACVG
jgi:putative transposase